MKLAKEFMERKQRVFNNQSIKSDAIWNFLQDIQYELNAIYIEEGKPTKPYLFQKMDRPQTVSQGDDEYGMESY